MSRYIDADALNWLLEEYKLQVTEETDFVFADFIKEMQEIVDKQPTVDAVPVSYIYKRAKELKNDDMLYAYTVLNSLIANYRSEGEK